MADNVQLALQTTGQTVSTEDNGSGIQLARSKIMLGAAHTDGGDVTSTNPFPVTIISAAASGAALDSSVNGVLLAQASTTAGQTGPLIQGAVTTAAPAYTTAKTSPLSLTTAGNLRVDGSTVTQPVSITAAQTLATVTTVTTVTAVTAITNALPAGTNLLGSVAAGQQVNQMFNGTTGLTVNYTIVDTAASGDNTIVAAQGGSKQIYVIKWMLMASGGANNVRWIDGTPTNLTGLMNLLANQPVSGSYCPVGHFATAANKLLKLNLSAATQVSGYVVWVTF